MIFKKVKYSLGCIKDELDSRDFSFASKVPIKEKVDLSEYFPTCWDQKNTNSCVGHAVAAVCTYTNKQRYHMSRLFPYYCSREYEGRPNIDQGTSIRNSVKMVEKKGICKEGTWPFAVDKVTTQPSKTAYDEAITYQSIKYWKVEQSPRMIQQALTEGFPILFGMAVYKSMETPAVRKSGKVPLPGWRWFDKFRGWHAVVLIGYDNNTREYLVRNSWGPFWGIKGNFNLPFDYVHNPSLATDFWVIEALEQ